MAFFSATLTLAVLLFIPTSTDAHKLRVDDPNESDQLLARGARLVADYGSYQVLEVDVVNPEVLRGRKISVRDDYNIIRLNAGPLDTTKAEIKALRKPVVPFKGRRMYLVQFAGPVLPEWRAKLLGTGVKIVTYIPQNTYLVYGNAQSLARLQQLAAAADYIQWEAAYADDYKINPKARKVDTNEFTIQMVSDAEANPATLQLIDSLKLGPIRRHSNVLDYVNITVRLQPGSLQKIAAQPDVVSIHPYHEPRKLGERQSQIIAGNLSGSSPSGPGYLAWLASKGFTQAQFDASGLVVDISDSGVDNGTTTPNHFGLYVSGALSGTGRVVYARLEGTPHGGSTLQGCDGHGNLNAHIVAGYNDLPNGFPHTDTNGFHYGLGVCPFVRVGASVIFDPSAFTNPNYTDLQSRAYRDGARISNNSWGFSSAALFGAYDANSQEYDALVRDAQPASAAVPSASNQEMTIIFAAGNDGPTGNTVRPPATAKNVISVGAAENVQSFGGSDDCGISDGAADSADDVANLSSRGPCDDSRKKPDICAPGTHVSGGVPQAVTPGTNGTANPCFNGSDVCGGVGSIYYPPGQQWYTASSGTSHSAPAIAGGCALLRQYFLNNFGGAPSPAMTKAFLLNSTRYLTGSGANDTLPSDNQGMGEMNLGMAFDGTPRVLRDQVNADRFTASGQTRTFIGTVADPSKPFRVTLAWTDAPGSTAGNAYNNDLDLTVTIGGDTYKGNVFSGANSVTGGTADPRNNVESVFLPPTVSGVFTVTVTAANINSDGVPNNADPLDQDFALVVYNGSQPSNPVVVVDRGVLMTESCSAPNGTIDPDEMVTVDFALQNIGTGVISNLVATLLATGGVTSPSGPQTYGVLASGASPASRPFTFTANGVCGGSVTATLQLQNGTNSLGSVQFVFDLGVPESGTTTNTYSSGGLLTAIPDLGTVEVPISITDAGLVADVNVIVRLNHTWDADLVIDLVHPDGTVVNLASNRGGSEDNYGVGGSPSFNLNAIINEFSQGANTNKEWVEILFLKNSDARGWKLFDSNSGTITFSGDGLWSNVTAGTLLVVYNASDRDTILPPDDTDPSDGTLVIPHNATNYLSGSWIALNNAADSIGLSDASSSLIHGLSYGTNTTYSTPKLGSVAAGKSASYIGNTEEGVTTNVSWQVINAASATPAAANGAANSSLIAQARAAVGCSGALFTIFDDNAGMPISSGNPPFAGTFSPEQALSVLTNKPLQGAWKIRISDVSASDTGALYCWELQIARRPYVCCASPVNSRPVVSGADIVPSPNAFSDEPLTVTEIIASDAEFDPITLAFQWQFSTNGTAFINELGATTDTLPAAAENSEKVWRCQITPSDPSGAGASFFTTTVTVNNRPVVLGRHGQSYSYDSDLLVLGLAGGVFNRNAIINEFSQGASGSKEWVEILFLKNSDARGWKLFDSNSGTLTFTSNGLWSNVTEGTLLVVYNASDRDTVLPANDVDPSDATLVIPHTNSTFFSGAWILLSNTGDSISLIDANAKLIDGISYGTNTNQVPRLGSVGATSSASYTNDTEAGVDIVGNWQIVDYLSATPAAGNWTVNSNFVASLRSGVFSFPLYRFGASGNSVPGLSINTTNGIISGIVNAPTGGFFNIVIERYLGTNIVSQQYNLLVGDSNNVYTIPAGKTWVMNSDYIIGGTLIVQGVLDTAGHTLTVSNTLDVASGTVNNDSGMIVYHCLVGGPLPGNSQEFNAQSPSITCPASILTNTTAGSCVASNVTWTVIFADDCPGATASCTPESGSTFAEGTNTVSCAVVDASGNSNNCSFAVIVVDNQPPSISCPVDVTVNADTGLCTASGVALGSPVTGDNCGVASVVNNAPASYPVGTNSVIWTVTDIHANSRSCTQKVIVVDNQLPSISCPVDVTVNVDTGLCTASGVALGSPVTGDNCGVASVVNNAPANYPIGTNSVIWTVTDIHANSRSCTQKVIVVDAAPTINVVATDPNASEVGPDPGAFTVSRNCTVGNLAVNYSLTGTAVNGTDYVTLPGSVTISNGSSSAIVTVTPIDDTSAECPETVVLTLSPSPNYTIGASSNAVVTIADNDSTVTITATDPNASETGPDPGAFSVSRGTACTNAALTVFYMLSGSASNGVDYVALSGSVTISAGAGSASVVVTPIDDQIVEGTETVIATILSNANYIVGSPSSATVNITDNDTPPSLSVTSATYSVLIGNAGTIIDPGETVQETIVLRNTGTVPAAAVSGALSTTNAGITITQPTSAYPNVPGSGGTATNTTPFQYRLAKTVPCGSTITFTHVAVTGGLSFTNTFSRLVGNLSTVLNTNTFASTNVPKTVANLTTVYSTNTVSLAATNLIADVNVSLRMNETRDGDLVIAIQHPDSTEVILSNNRGGTGQNFGTGTCGAGEVRTVFDDEAATAISAGSAPFAGSFRPDGVLSNFDGKTLNGNWRLRISDTQNPNSTGTLTCWSLHVISSQQALSCSVFNNPPVASNQTISLHANTTTNLTLKGSDVDGDPISFRTNSLPGQGTLSNFNTLTGAITYTPVTNFTGSDSFTFTVNDGATSSAPATVSITVFNNAPVASNQTVAINANTATNLILKGSDVDGDPISFRTNSLPAHGTLSSFSTLTGAITYTPTAGYVGPDSFSFTVNDGLTSSVPATVSIVVNDTPPFLSITNVTYSVAIGNAGSVIDPGETVQETIVLRNTGTLPAVAVSGTLSTTNAGITITQPTSAYPNVPGSGGTATNSTPFQYRLAKTVPCGSTITFRHVAVTGGLSFTSAFSRVVGQLATVLNTNTFASTNVPKTVPNNTTVFSTNTVSLAATNFIADVNVSLRMNETRDGDLVIAIQHPDGTEVILSNNRGGAGDDFGTGTCGAGEVRTVFDDEAATAISAGSPPFASSFRPDGVLSNFDGKTLNGNWRLRISDTIGNNSTGTLTCWSLHVISSQQVLSCSVFNNPPVASNQSVLVNINTATGLVLKGSDADGDPITFRTNSLPLHGTLSNFNTLTGAITYSPVTSFTGSDSFTFLVNDGATNSTPATVSITVLNNPPVASNQTVSVPANTATNLTLRGSDPDGSPISFRTNSLPANGTLSNFNTLTGAITYTPGTSFVGADSFTFLVNDGLTNSAPGTVSITVVSVDSVGDGIPDWWRAQYFGGNGTTTNSQSCALCDPDGDGMGNLSEYLSGTVPTNSASVFRIISITHENESVRVTWTTVGQKTYQVQLSTEPAGGYSTNFVDLGSPVIVPGVGESMTNYVDVGASTNAPGRYYRLRLVP